LVRRQLSLGTPYIQTQPVTLTDCSNSGGDGSRWRQVAGCCRQTTAAAGAVAVAAADVPLGTQK